MVTGPRQIGKTALLLKTPPPPKTKIFLDDPAELQNMTRNPEFVFSQAELPMLIDEIQRAPQALVSIKNQIDLKRRERLENGTPTIPASFRLNGSNQTELYQNTQETLAGRVSVFQLHGLSVNELLRHDASIPLKQILFRGGFPELWVRTELSPIGFINDYIRTFIEKDIAQSAGVEKLLEFNSFLRLIAARTAELINFESLGKDAGVAGKTIKDWVSLLERNSIVTLLQPYHSNLNKRLIKIPKLYFLDTGLCVRLQSHQEVDSILSTPHAGHLFENLVVAEVIKAKDHFKQEWNLHFWRTKEKEEIDLIVETHSQIFLIEIKIAASAAEDFQTPKALLASNKKTHKLCVVAHGEPRRLNSEIEIVPIKNLCEFLLAKS